MSDDRDDDRLCVRAGFERLLLHLVHRALPQHSKRLRHTFSEQLVSA
jgi:hypothetical protein